MTFEQAKDRVSEQVYAVKQRAETRKYLEKLRAQSIIEWKNAELKKAYEQVIAEATPGV